MDGVAENESVNDGLRENDEEAEGESERLGVGDHVPECDSDGVFVSETVADGSLEVVSVIDCDFSGESLIV